MTLPPKVVSRKGLVVEPIVSGDGVATGLSTGEAEVPDSMVVLGAIADSIVDDTTAVNEATPGRGNVTDKLNVELNRSGIATALSVVISDTKDGSSTEIAPLGDS